MYAVTRVLATVANKKALDGVCLENIKLMHQYFGKLDELCSEWSSQCTDSVFMEISHMCQERKEYLKVRIV